jgi:hypothetical protein
MRKLFLPIVLAGGLSLGGCTTAGIAEQVLGSVLGGGLGGQGGYGQGGYGNQSFQQAAVNACGQYAQQYGQVRIDNMQQGGSVLRVYGTVQRSQYDQRQFACDFSSNGRITNFNFAR